MLGYVTVNKNSLSEDEKRIYNGYYCGVCKSIGSRYGQIPRLALSYDIVFLALILSSLKEEDSEIKDQHCIIHPVTRKPVVLNDEGVDYAADMLLILSYYNFLDDIRDEGSIKGSAGKWILSDPYERVYEKYPDICEEVALKIDELSGLENENSGDIDRTARIFGEMLKSIFSGFAYGNNALEGLDEKTERVLGELGLNLGSWIYLIDALDDYDKDLEKNNYNPFIYRERGKEGTNAVLYNYLGNIMGAIDLLDIKKNKGIIDNIVLMGLRARTDLILEREKREDNNG